MNKKITLLRFFQIKERTQPDSKNENLLYSSTSTNMNLEVPMNSITTLENGQRWIKVLFVVIKKNFMILPTGCQISTVPTKSLC